MKYFFHNEGWRNVTLVSSADLLMDHHMRDLVLDGGHEVPATVDREVLQSFLDAHSGVAIVKREDVGLPPVNERPEYPLGS